MILTYDEEDKKSYTVDLGNPDKSIAYYYQNLGNDAEVYSVHAIPTKGKEIEFKLKVQLINGQNQYTIGSTTFVQGAEETPAAFQE